MALGTTAPAAAQEHQHAHQGLPALKPIPAGALHTVADVQFMQGMIAHHGQAIHMSKLAEVRSTQWPALRLAKKIDQSQASEIQLMQEWLEAQQADGSRHLLVSHDHHGGDAHHRAAARSSTGSAARRSTAAFLN